MSETAPVNAPAADPAAGAPPVAPDPAAGAPPAAPAAPEVDPFESGANSFDRAYVEKLRKENADRRVALKDYEEAFQAYSPEEREVWKGLAKLTALDAKAGAQALRELSEALEAGATPEQAAAAAGIQPEGADKPMTKAELEAFWNEKQSEAEVNIKAQVIQDKAVAAGYQPGTVAYKALMIRAMDEHNYDLDAAIAADKADKQKVIDDFVAERAAAGQKWTATTPPAGTGSPNTQVKEIKTFEEARASLRARVEAQAGQ